VFYLKVRIELFLIFLIFLKGLVQAESIQCHLFVTHDLFYQIGVISLKYLRHVTEAWGLFLIRQRFAVVWELFLSYCQPTAIVMEKITSARSTLV
jgi:hypothetical protein